MANNTDNKTAKAIHINELRRALDISRIDRTPVDLDCWKAGDGSIIQYRGWLVKSSSWQQGTHNLYNSLAAAVSANIARIRKENIREALDGKEPTHKATWNAVCLADFGDNGAAFVALPQIPPRNVSWFSQGKWVHLAKIAFEKFYMRKIKKGTSEHIFEKMVMSSLGIMKLKDK